MTLRPAKRPFGRKRLNQPYWLGIAAMLLVAAAAYMPWVLGIDGVRFMDGRVTLVMAVGGLVATAFGSGLLGRRLTKTARMVVSTICGAITVFTSSGDLGHGAEIGVWLTLLGGVVWIFALIWEYNEDKRLNW